MCVKCIKVESVSCKMLLTCAVVYIPEATRSQKIITSRCIVSVFDICFVIVYVSHTGNRHKSGSRAQSYH